MNVFETIDTMKKKGLVILLLMAFPLSIFSMNGMSFSSSQTSKTMNSPIRHQQFAMGHIGASLYPDFSFGATYGQVDIIGWYANITTDFGFNFSSDYEADANGLIDGDYPFYTGVKKTSYISLSAGWVVRLEVPSVDLPLFLLAGLGYGNRTVNYEMADGSWATWKTPSSPGSGLKWEIMGMTKYEDIAISLGIASVTDFNKSNFFELKIGGGYFF